MAQLKNTTISDVGYLELPTGSTRPSSPSVGMVRYNSSSGNVEGYAASGWHILSPINLAITAVTPVSGFVDALSSTKIINPGTASVFTISGFNFTPTTTVKFDSFTLPSGMVTYVNPETLSINTGTSGLTSGSYSTVVVVDSNGKTASLSYPITVTGGPVFSTASNLGTITEGVISITVAATSPGATVTYSANSTPGNGGSGYGLPAGLSIASGTGVISGTLIDYTGGNITYNLTIKATDSNAKTASKDFTFILTNSSSPIIGSPAAGSIGTLYYSPVPNGAGVSSAPSSPGITSIITSSNPSGTTLEYILSSGSLPPGVSIDSSTGALYGNIIIGTRNPTGQVYNFGVTVRDSYNNTSPEVQYSLTTNIPYYYRQILSTGYSIAGYKSSTPWKNVNRFPMATEITISLGDELTYAVNYHGGTCGPDKSYIMGCNSSGGMQATGSLTQIYNMRTEVGSVGYTSSYTRGAAAVWSGNDGFQAAAYTAGGFQGTGANVIEKMPYSTETAATISATLTNTTGFWNAITGSTETFAAIIGASASAFDGTSVTGSNFFTYSTDTISTASVNISNGAQEKVLSSKLNRVYGGSGGGTGGSSNFVKTVWSDLTQFTIACGYGNKGEENYIMGQDKGYCVGLYTGSAQVNDAFVMIYATDTSVTANYGLQRKATTGSSSGNYGYRD